MNPYCACGQEARIVEDREPNGQTNRFCEVCGKAPPPRRPMNLDGAMVQGLVWIEDALVQPWRRP